MVIKRHLLMRLISYCCVGVILRDLVECVELVFWCFVRRAECLVIFC